MRKSLTHLGVTIQDHTTVAQVTADAVLTNGSVIIPFDVCLWAGGFAVPPVARDAGLKVNERGQVLVDPFLRSI
jgi:NADH dehydrogenase FAD-containing subunit